MHDDSDSLDLDSDSLDLNLDRIVRHLADELGVPAYVEQTGGGCATIFAGHTTRTHDAAVGDYVAHAACAGPGTYGWSGPSTGTLLEFYVGRDDHGSTTCVTAYDVGARTEWDVARLIAAQARKPGTAALTADEIDALGFDSTGRAAS